MCCWAYRLVTINVPERIKKKRRVNDKISLKLSFLISICWILVSNNTMIPGGLIWRRDCSMKSEHELGCSEHDWKTPDGEIKVYECLCDTNLCNTDTHESSTTTSTTPKGIFRLIL